MATLIEYSEEDKNTIEWEPKLTTIGYLNTTPEDSLRDLFPNFYVVDYLGIPILSKSKYTNYNDGLKISQTQDGIGLVGTIELLEQNELFMKTQHKPFTKEQFGKIFEEMKSRILPTHSHQEALDHQKAEKYSLIFDVLGFPMSVEEIRKISQGKDYFKPILLTDIIH